jgi:tetratricopeptide (TPR) repeat protein
LQAASLLRVCNLLGALPRRRMPRVSRYPRGLETMTLIPTIRLARSVVLGLALGCLTVPVLPAHAEPAAGAAPQLPKLKSYSDPKRSTRKAYDELLNSLYDQLQKTSSAEAAATVEAAIERFWSRSGSDTADLLMQRAGAAIEARNYELAISLLTKITKIEPRYTAGWNQLATVYFMQNQYREAMHQLRRVLALDPRHYKAIEGLSIILRETGNKKAALRVTRQALAVNPHLKTAKQAEEELAREVEGQGI